MLRDISLYLQSKHKAMNSISTSKDIFTKNKKVASLFLCPEDAAGLIASIEGPVKEWVNKYNKQRWDVVRYVCEQRGLLGKRKRTGKVKLTRKDFANVLVAFCHAALVEKETASALEASMEKYPYNFKTMTDKSAAWKDIHEVESLLDQKVPAIQLQEAVPTLVERVVDYLKSAIDKLPDGYPKSVLLQRPSYTDIHPAVSVEFYQSERLYEASTPSHIDAYEFVEGKLTLSRLYELVGQYDGQQGVKLYTVSSFGLDANVRSVALKKHIGYIRLNPIIPMTSDSYELPRRVECYQSWQQLDDRLMWRSQMDIPLLIMDGVHLGTSFVDLWNERGLTPKRTQRLRVPFLSHEDVETRADSLTQSQVHQKIYMYKDSDADISIDPFTLAEELGLSYEICPLEDTYLLGRIDVAKGHVTLNAYGTAMQERFRFTMAHELGHFLLHTQWLTSHSLLSIEDTEETISDVIELSQDETQRAELQANSFAAHLLMPKELVGVLYYYYYHMYITPRTGHRPEPLYYSPTQPETYASYNYLIGNIAKRLKVSHEAVKYRLIGLKLLRIG